MEDHVRWDRWCLMWRRVGMGSIRRVTRAIKLKRLPREQLRLDL
jgi:hypothetical protein